MIHPIKKSVAFGMAVGLGLSAFAVVAPIAGADGNPTPTVIELHEPHQGLSLDDGSFVEEGECDGVDTTGGSVLHFVLNRLDKGASAAEIVVSFDTGELRIDDATKVNKKMQHFYVEAPTDAESVTTATVTFDEGHTRGKLVISHICPGDGEDEVIVS